MGNLIDKIPEILENSGSLFGVFALVAIIVAFVVFLLFRNSETKQKERIFVYMTLFFLAVVFSALTAGIFSGFESGSEIVSAQVEEDPSIIRLSSETIQKLENYINSRGERVSDSNKISSFRRSIRSLYKPSSTYTF